MIRVTIQEGGLWKKYSSEKITAFYKGYFYSQKISAIIESISSCDNENLNELIQNIDGHFAIVISNENLTIAIVDKIRSTPIFFSQIDNVFHLDSNPNRLTSNNKFLNEVNEDAKLEISMAGFSIGDKTLYKNLYSLRAGEFAIFKDKSYKVYQYFKYFSDVLTSQINYQETLSKITKNIFKKMLTDIGGRQIVIPLSAGNDSRLVASILRELGYSNVICYSYGLQGNFEAKTAKLIAKKLGYKWIFIPLKYQNERSFYLSDEYEEYLKFSETYSSVPYIQSLSTIKYLKQTNSINEDAVFINGNSGDFISGLHLNYLLNNDFQNEDAYLRKEVILDSIFKKHFLLWGELASNKNAKQIKKSLWSEIESQCGVLTDKKNDHIFYEYSEFIDRQSKYVITGQRAYEFYGYEWRMPLWDNEYLDFWVNVPASLKRNQSLYLDMLKKNNFAKVWGDDMPVNHKKISPKWFIPLRFILKIPFVFLGKKGKPLWHEFEIIFLYYWMDNTRMMSSISYWRVIKSIWKKPQNHVSWQAKDYINNHIK
jgi:asparagine synthase (glutamine-hydrolysing)